MGSGDGGASPLGGASMGLGIASIALVFGIGGFFGRASKPAAVAGLLLGGAGICLFFVIIRAVGG